MEKIIQGEFGEQVTHDHPGRRPVTGGKQGLDRTEAGKLDLGVWKKGLKQPEHTAEMDLLGRA